MIYDFSANFHKYTFAKSDVWQQIFSFISELTPELPPGRYTLRDDELFVNIQEYETKLPDDPSCALEWHRRYIDIQLLLSGEELVIYRPSDGLRGREPFSVEKDYALLEFQSDRSVAFPLYPGNFLMLLPEEAHMPCIVSGKKQTVKKAVVKIDRKVLGIFE